MSVRALLVWAALAVVLIHSAVLIRPGLFGDDFGILARSWTWAEARASLWVPQNEHTMPLGRLTTWALIQLCPDLRVLPYLCDLQGVLAVVLGMVLVYAFVRREVELPLVGVLAAVLFSVTAVYQQAVTWFAASFSVLALDTFLLALLAAQAWRRRTGRGLWLDLCLLGCCAAPGWFASGILAGPLCFLYLLVPQDATAPGGRLGRVSLAPLLGTGMFLAVALPQVAQTILHLEHYQGKTAVEAFDPVVGLAFTARSLVDNLALGQLGITLVSLPIWLVGLLLPALMAGVVVWVLPGRQWRLVLLGAATILSSYVLTYSARAGWGYDDVRLYTPTWSRYHLFPQLGLVLLVAAGLPYWLPRLATWLRPEADGISRAQGRAVCLLIVFLTVVNLPRGLAGTPMGWGQGPDEIRASLKE